MSGLAKILLVQGARISGSDLKLNSLTEELQAQGALIFQGHKREYLPPEAEVVVFSSAVPLNNPEVSAARERGLPVVSRGEMLALLMEGKRGVAVAGAHGKTTTTAMIAHVLVKNKFDPLVVVGGEALDLGGNARFGQGEFFVAEADESDGSFLKLSPEFAAVTSIENDHLNHYQTMEKMVDAYREFLQKVPPGGSVFLALPNPYLSELLASSFSASIVTYGLEANATYHAAPYLDSPLAAAPVFYGYKKLGELELNVPGTHNLVNALAAVAFGHQLGLDFQEIGAALASFRGVKRRFQFLGEAGGVRIFDDYAHHPTEIKAALEVASQLGARRLVVVFQPHRYTRTRQLYQEFGEVLAKADVLIVSEIYPAGEAPLPGVTAALIVEAARRQGKPTVLYLPRLEDVLVYLQASVCPEDLVLTLGAGDVWEVGSCLYQFLSSKAGG